MNGRKAARMISGGMCVALLAAVVAGCAVDATPGATDDSTDVGDVPGDSFPTNGTPPAPPVPSGTSTSTPAPPPPAQPQSTRPPSTAGQACETDADCNGDADYTAGVCSANKTCASAPSCREEDGGYTCGPNKDQDCCASPPVPGQKATIDAYLITAGRMREFVNQVGGNVQGWYLAHQQALPQATRAQIDPYLDATSGNPRGIVLPSDMHSYPWGVDYQLGGTVYTGNYPSMESGCYIGTPDENAYGAHTFDNGPAEGDERGYPTSYLDRLPINCVTYVMLAAFCAWDGGRLSTTDEHLAIGGTGLGNTYIWGNSPEAGGFARDDDQTIVGPAIGGGFLDALGNGCPTCDVQHVNWQQSYEHIRFDPNDDSNPSFYPPLEPGIPPRDVPVNYAYATSDLTFYISPPGRYPYDAYPPGDDLSKKTHYDVMGNMFEIQGDPSTDDKSDIAAPASLYCSADSDCVTSSCDTDTHVCTGTQDEPTASWLGGSWEGHPLDSTASIPMMAKYGKAGGRCARDP